MPNAYTAEVLSTSPIAVLTPDATVAYTAAMTNPTSNSYVPVDEDSVATLVTGTKLGVRGLNFTHSPLTPVTSRGIYPSAQYYTACGMFTDQATAAACVAAANSAAFTLSFVIQICGNSRATSSTTYANNIINIGTGYNSTYVDVGVRLAGKTLQVLKGCSGNGIAGAAVVEAVLTEGERYHITCTIQGTDMTLYVDGVETDTAIATPSQGTGALPFCMIGMLAYNHDSQANCILTDVAVYDKTLNTTAISAQAAHIAPYKTVLYPSQYNNLTQWVEMPMPTAMAGTWDESYAYGFVCANPRTDKITLGLTFYGYGSNTLIVSADKRGVQDRCYREIESTTINTITIGDGIEFVRPQPWGEAMLAWTAGYISSGVRTAASIDGGETWGSAVAGMNPSVSTASSGYMNDYEMTASGKYGFSIQKYGANAVCSDTPTVNGNYWLPRTGSVYPYNSGCVATNLGSEGGLFLYGNPSSDYLSRYTFISEEDLKLHADSVIAWENNGYTGTLIGLPNTATEMPHSDIRGNYPARAVGINNKLLWARYANASDPAWLMYDGITVTPFIEPDDRIENIIHNYADTVVLISRAGRVFKTTDAVTYTELAQLPLAFSKYGQGGYRGRYAMDTTHIYAYYPRKYLLNLRYA